MVFAWSGGRGGACFGGGKSIIVVGMDGIKDGFNLVGNVVGDVIFEGVEKLVGSFGLFHHTVDCCLEAVTEVGKHAFGVLLNA